jgi:hypothetical protein
VTAWFTQGAPPILALAFVVAASYGLILSVATPMWVPIAATAVALLGAIVTAVPSARNMPAWDLIAWENKVTLPEVKPDQQQNTQFVGRAAQAMAIRKPDRVRAALSQVDRPSAWISFLTGYLSGQADILEKRKPDTVELRADIEHLEDAYRPTARIMLAALEGGCEWLARSDWRAPFVACRADLNIKPSIWRGLLPVRYFVIMLAAAQLVPWAWWLWGN